MAWQRLRHAANVASGLLALVAGLCCASPSQAQPRLYACPGEAQPYQVLDWSGPVPAGCLPYNGKDRAAIAAQSAFDARIPKERMPSAWTALDMQANGCLYHVLAPTIRGPRNARKGWFLATCDPPTEVVEGFAVRSLELEMIVDCEQDAFSYTTMLAREGPYGGQIRGWQKKTLQELPLAKAQAGTLSAAITHALCGFALVSAQEAAGLIAAPSERVAGLRPLDWASPWLQWYIDAQSVPGIGPTQDPNGDRCGVMQRGPVWFLVGGNGFQRVDRICRLPKGRHIFFPVGSWMMEAGSTAAGCERVGAQVRSIANRLDDKQFFVELDGLRLPDLSPYRPVKVPCIEVQHAIGRATWALDSHFILIKSLPPGWHTLKFGHLGEPGFLASYTLIVE